MSIMLLLLMIGSLAPVAAGGNVTITVTGTQPAGKVLGQVFADAESFKARTNPVVRFAIEPNGGADVQTTISLPPGRYMVAMFQDTKGTGKIETNMFGAPKVPYGFSNNARGRFGPPSFEEAAFEVGTAAVFLAIHLR